MNARAGMNVSSTTPPQGSHLLKDFGDPPRVESNRFLAIDLIQVVCLRWTFCHSSPPNVDTAGSVLAGLMACEPPHQICGAEEMAAADGVRRQRVFWRLMAVPLLLLVVLSRTGGAAGAELQRVEDEDERPDEWSRPGGMREWDGHMLWDDDVLVLNGRNFEMGVRSAPHMLVEFYAPWCGHCQKFEPVYQKVASHLRLEGVPVVLAKVDSISNPVLTKERGIAGFLSRVRHPRMRKRRARRARRANPTRRGTTTTTIRAIRIRIPSSPEIRTRRGS